MSGQASWVTVGRLLLRTGANQNRFGPAPHLDGIVCHEAVAAHYEIQCDELDESEIEELPDTGEEP